MVANSSGHIGIYMFGMELVSAQRKGYDLIGIDGH